MKKYKVVQDIQLIREAASFGDEDAILAKALLRMLDSELEKAIRYYQNAWKVYLKCFRYHPKTNVKRFGYCFSMGHRISILVHQRNRLIYKDYKIQGKRSAIQLKLNAKPEIL